MRPAQGITIRGAKYPLEDEKIRSDYQYGISNEVLPGKTAVISLLEGCLLLLKGCFVLSLFSILTGNGVT